MYWRRFAVKDIPLSDPEEFETWLKERWTEKDALMEQYLTTGRFPPSVPATDGVLATIPKGEEFIETEVRLKKSWEILQMFTVLATLALIANLAAKLWNMALYGKQY